MITKFKLYILFLFLFLISQVLAYGYENKIMFKINNEIITSLDIKNEANYLLALNPRLADLDENEVFEISKNSIIKEKIKKIELDKILKLEEPPQEFLEKLLINIYSNLGISDLPEFKKYIKDKNISYDYVLDKIKIEAIWNEIIVAKFSSKIKIDEKKLREKINNKKNFGTKSYLMSEIVFEVKELKDLEAKFDEIKKTILKQGFANAALKYSISQTSTIGGKLDWIKENSLNENIKKNLIKIKTNEFTDPIAIPGGFLILKINKIKKEDINFNVEKELKNIVKSLRNNQYNQFSNMYFNKLKKNILIDEI